MKKLYCSKKHLFLTGITCFFLLFGCSKHTGIQKIGVVNPSRSGEVITQSYVNEMQKENPEVMVLFSPTTRETEAMDKWIKHLYEEKIDLFVSITEMPIQRLQVLYPEWKVPVLFFMDNGHGMTEDIRKKVFDPFFTTRRGYGGSGIGLHVVYNLVTNRLKGTVSCISTRGKGTEFHITLPLSQRIKEHG